MYLMQEGSAKKASTTRKKIVAVVSANKPKKGITEHEKNVLGETIFKVLAL